MEIIQKVKCRLKNQEDGEYDVYYPTDAEDYPFCSSNPLVATLKSVYDEVIVVLCPHAHESKLLNWGKNPRVKKPKHILEVY